MLTTDQPAARSLVTGSDDAKVEEHGCTPRPLALELLRLYRNAFTVLATRAPARQAHTDEEFLAEMADPAVLKLVARASDGSPRGLAILSNDLQTVPWISPTYYETRFSQHAAHGTLWYVTAIIVDTEHQGGPWASMLLTSVIGHVAARRGVAAFDCCLYNVETVGLPRLVGLVAQRMAGVEFVELDTQQYYALVLDGSAA